MVERDLAKVEVTSSNLVTRSNFSRLLIPITTRILRGFRAKLLVGFARGLQNPWFFMARWQSGDAADCKSVYAGSIPTRASIFIEVSARGDSRQIKTTWRQAPTIARKTSRFCWCRSTPAIRIQMLQRTDQRRVGQKTQRPIKAENAKCSLLPLPRAYRVHA